jgi:hypothetical protein
MEKQYFERLDNAFLFALSFVGLIVSFIQVTMRDLSLVVESIPFIAVGIFLPFYVGYLRGAIEIDTLNERMRGWIYFVIGIGSYFAFFISTWLVANYPNIQYVQRQTLVYIIIGLSLLLTYRFLKWSRRIFASDQSMNEYIASGTALCAFTTSFLFTLLLGYWRDFSERDIMGMVMSGSPEPFFWFAIILAVISIVIIGEKACQSVLDAKLELPVFRKKYQWLTEMFPIKGLLLGTMLLEYTFDYNLRARLLWISCFAFWVLGCLLWLVGGGLVSQIFFLLAIISVLIADAVLQRTNIVSFKGLERVKPDKATYISIFFVGIITMLSLNSLLLGSIIIILGTIVQCLSYIDQKPKKGKII